MGSGRRSATTKAVIFIECSPFLEKDRGGGGRKAPMWLFVSFYILLSLLEACEGDSGLPVVLDSETPEKVVAVYVAGSDSNIGACGVLPGSKGIAEKLTHPVINFWINNFPKI